LEIAYGSKASMFHVHLHEHLGTPRFSPTDTRESAKFVPDFFRSLPECARRIVWSRDRAIGRAGCQRAQPVQTSDVVEIGAPVWFRWWKKWRDFSRQSFFPDLTAAIFASVIVGVVGLGGGGLHVVQQLAHLGVRQFVIARSRRRRDHNLTGWSEQRVGCRGAPAKVRIAERIIAGSPYGHRSSQFRTRASRAIESVPAMSYSVVWTPFPSAINSSNFLDASSFRTSMSAWTCTRWATSSSSVARSPSLRRASIVCGAWASDKESIGEEARQYGAAGGRPQVVWPNGRSRFGRSGLFVQLVTPWHGHPISTAYFEYDGNAHTVKVQ